MTQRIAIEAMDRHINSQVVRLASLVHSEVTKGTPVDTGWARANWVPSIGVPATLDGERPKKGAAPASAAQRAGRAQRGLIEIVSRYNYQRGIAIFITNNVPYVRHLDRRHKQRRGFINKGIQRALSRFFR